MATEIIEVVDVAEHTKPQISEGARLRAQGSSVQFKDKSNHRLVFDYEALEQLEETFTDIQTVVLRLQESGYASKRLQFVRNVMAAAMLHEKPEGEPFDAWTLGLRKQLDIARLPEYLNALVYALAEAFPQFEIVEELPKAKDPSSSRGDASTTSPPSSSGERRRSSGA